jgi:hypothetical protein
MYKKSRDVWRKHRKRQAKVKAKKKAARQKPAA